MQHLSLMKLSYHLRSVVIVAILRFSSSFKKRMWSTGQSGTDLQLDIRLSASRVLGDWSILYIHFSKTVARTWKTAVLYIVIAHSSLSCECYCAIECVLHSGLLSHVHPVSTHAWAINTWIEKPRAKYYNSAQPLKEVVLEKPAFWHLILAYNQ